jgi:hypothetical protein
MSIWWTECPNNFARLSKVSSKDRGSSGNCFARSRQRPCLNVRRWKKRSVARAAQRCRVSAAVYEPFESHRCGLPDASHAQRRARARGLLAIRDMTITHRRSLLFVGLAAWAALVACAESDPADPGADPEPDPDPLPAVAIEEGTTIGADVFPAGNTASGGQGGEVSGIRCIDTIARHFHAHVSFFFEGEQIAIPAAIGITDPMIRDGYVVAGDCYYWLHTHDASGVIHIEPPDDADYTLGQLFDVWGQPLSTTNTAGYQGELSVFVDGLRYDGDPRGIVFESRTHISLQVGRPLSPIPMYVFQP